MSQDTHKHFGKVAAAVAGVVVGAGAVIAGAVALNDKKNKQKVSDLIGKAKDMVKGYGTKSIKSVEKVTKLAKKGVKKI